MAPKPQPRRRPKLRRRLVAVGVLVLLAAVAIWATYPGIGRLAYDVTIGTETRLAGLHTEQTEVDGLQMAYYEGGPLDAPTIVLLHGFSADRDVWARFAAKFNDDYHVIIPDLAGHGDTPFVSGVDYSAPAQAIRVAGLLDQLGIDQVHIIGNSMGGFIAATFALENPERTLSLGLSDAAGVISPEASEMNTMTEAGNTNPFLFTDPSKYDDFYAMTMEKPPFLPGFVKDALAQDQAERRDQLAEITADFGGNDLLDDRLAEITAPSLVLWGEGDRIISPTAAEVWVAGLPDSRLVTYPGVGHLPMLEIPELTAADYRAFLANLN
ncbi:alpha/beta fold hydrolase [Salinibacterium sp. M195]|uniref:alpha/beta fold hydrolase n=1 Tax=Salinibacterium sp. M195 TaxID=2583374 RepID=UPI001C62AF80|nr:alpha/beta fold hydrolase [Salinibacterium sp. M195]